jgi:exodeoxyribonuclease VII small subunit
LISPISLEWLGSVTAVNPLPALSHFILALEDYDDVLGYNPYMIADLFGECKEPEMTPKKSAPRDPADEPSPEFAASGRPTADTESQPRTTSAGPPPAAVHQLDTDPGFEESFSRLEQLVAEMERGDLALEELLSRFEEGVRLVKHCEQFLKQAQQRVLRYVEQKDGHWVLKELEGQN